MMQAPQTRSDGPSSVFLGHRWIENSILEYGQGHKKLATLKGRTVLFPERHFAAALMHLYVGTFSVAEIAAMVSVSPAELAFLRTQIDFMMLVDALKVSFSRYFRENLILNEYSPVDYASIAAEYAAFEELARNQIRVPLFRRMIQLANSISNKDRHHLPIDLYDLRSFRKLFSFFVFEESFLPNMARPSFKQVKTIAKEIVWNRLGEDYAEVDSLLSTVPSGPEVKDELKTLFMSLNLH